MKERTRREKEESNRRIKELEGEIASRPTVFVPTPSAPTPVVTPSAPPATPSAPASTNNNSNNNAPPTPKPTNNAPPTPKPTNNARPTPKPANNARPTPKPANNAESEAVKKIRGLRLPRNLEKSIIKRFRYNNVNTVVTLARETKRLQDQVNRLSNLTPRDRAEFIGKMLKDGNYDTVLGEARKKNNETREGKETNAKKRAKEDEIKRKMLNIAKGDRAYLKSYMIGERIESASKINQNKLKEKVGKDMEVAKLKAKAVGPGLFGAAPRPKLVYISKNNYEEELQKATKKKTEKESRNKQKGDEETEAKEILNREKGDLPLYERQRLYAAWSRNRNTDELKKQVESRVKVFQLSKNNNIGWSVEKIDKEVKAGKINVSIISDVRFKKRIEGIKKKKNQEEADKTRLKLNQERVKQEEKEKKRREASEAREAKAAEKTRREEEKAAEKERIKNKRERNEATLKTKNDLTNDDHRKIMKKWKPDGFNLNREIEAARAKKLANEQKATKKREETRRNAKLAELKRKAGGRVSKAGRGGQWTDKTIEEAAKASRRS